MPRRIYPTHAFHTTPLHYAPFLLATGCLYSQARLRADALPVRPRRTAAARDRKLKLDGFVHLSFTAHTPLLADKLARGYPHMLIAFSFDELLTRPGSVLVKFNAKSWRHRDDFAPIADSGGKAALLAEWMTGRYPSAELLIPDTLPLDKFAQTIYAATDNEAQWLSQLRTLPYCLESAQDNLPSTTQVPIVVDSELFPSPRTPIDWSPLWEYAENCSMAGYILPPPNLPFD